MRNLQKLIKKVTSKYRYEMRPPIYNTTWIEKPLSDKAANIVLKEIYRQLLDPQISSSKYKYLMNLYCKYLHNSGLMTSMNIGTVASDFDGDTLECGGFESVDIISKTLPMRCESLEIMMEGISGRSQTIKAKHCTHRFSNGNSALVDIGNGMCKCELCNLEFDKDIVDDSYSITNQKEINKKINDINLDELFNEEE